MAGTIPPQPREMPFDPRVLELAITQRNRLRECLCELVAHVRYVGGYMSGPQQEMLWKAESALREIPK